MARKRKNTALSEDEEIVLEAQKRFKRCEDWESTFRSRYREDTKFYNGDPDNGYQWPIEVRKNRDVERKPVLTINKARQYALNIINDAKQNKPSIKVRPVGNEATFEGAEVMEGIIRHIEYQSNAQVAYDTATERQVIGGKGFIRVQSDYVDGESFDQELYIRRVKDPLKVYIDPDIQELDGSDAMFGFVFENVPRDTFDDEYPEAAKKIGAANSGLSSGENDWINKDHVRVCEYYRRVRVTTAIVAFVDPMDGETKIVRGDKVPKSILDQIVADQNTRRRPLTEYIVEWYKIAGDMIIDRSIWVGTTIPIVPVIGEESIIDGKYDCKGHIRSIKDPQRIYNYWTSSAVENVALQTKIPYVGPLKAFENLTEYWRTANTENHAFLPFNHLDDDGNPVPMPQRQQPPVMASAYIQGMQIAAQEMRMVTGQYQEDMGEQSNAISGKAINARQRQGDNATYHFIDNLAVAIRYVGRILLECIPKVYDTKRTLKIMGEDGVESSITIDPAARVEYMRQRVQDEEKIRAVFNPGFAKYSVEADVGPAYATRRQEAFNAFTQILSANPALVQVAGDLMFRAADFPMAEELADRLKRMVPPFVLGNGPDPQTQQLMQQNQQLMQRISELMQSYTEERRSRKAEEQQKDIDAFKAETDRLKVLLSDFKPEQIASLTAQLVLQTLGTTVSPQALAIDLNQGAGAQ